MNVHPLAYRTLTKLNLYPWLDLPWLSREVNMQIEFKHENGRFHYRHCCDSRNSISGQYCIARLREYILLPQCRFLTVEQLLKVHLLLYHLLQNISDLSVLILQYLTTSSLEKWI